MAVEQIRSLDANQLEVVLLLAQLDGIVAIVCQNEV